MSVHHLRVGMTAVLLAAGCSKEAATVDQAADSAVQSAPGGIEGAWRVVHAKIDDADTLNAPAGLFVFTADRYSIMYANAARRPYAKPDAATNAEKLHGYDTFVANAGSYLTTGDTITIRPVISRNPNYMGGGEDKFVVRLSGDTLTLTSVAGAFRWASGQAAAAQSTDSFTLVRDR